MFKFMFPAIMCVAMCFPMVSAAQDCGCSQPDPCCVKTRKKLALVDVQKERCRLTRECVTDECGCTKKKFVRSTECVTVKRLKCVETPVDPCKKGCFARLKERCASKSCCEPEPCCDAPAPCGCN